MTTPSIDPSVTHLDEQPYVGITDTVTMTTFAKIADRYGEVFGWAAEHGLNPVGAPFFRYHVIDMERGLVITAGVPVDRPAPASADDDDDDVQPGVLPAGSYVTTTHHGHPNELVEVTGQLLEWAAGQGLTFEEHPSDAGDVWGCRLEFHETDPDEGLPMEEWTTRLAFKLAD